MVIKKPYLLTGGLVPLIENRHKISLGKNTKPALRKLEYDYFSATADFLNGRQELDENGKVKYEWDVQFMSDELIDSQLANLILSSKAGRSVISFDDVYCQDLADGNYHVTRVQNPNKLQERPQLGPRFANADLEDQIAHIRKRYGPEIDVMDIGVFAGDTLSGEIKRFADGGVKIGNIYVMFAGREGIDKIANMGASLKYVQEVDWVDWLEMRDCMGFDGRKVKMEGGKDSPANSFVRYTERPTDWASIPYDVKHHYERLYDSSFKEVQAILASDGIDVSLSQSPKHSLVYDLRIGRR